MMLRSLAEQPPATDKEVAAIRRKVRKNADPDKVAVVARVLPGDKSSSPRELVKTFVATTDDINSLGRDLRPTLGVGPTSGPDGPGTEADRRGVGRAKTVVALSDNGHPKAGRCAAAFRPCLSVTLRVSR